MLCDIDLDTLSRFVSSAITRMTGRLRRAGTHRFWPAAAQPVLFPPPTDAENQPLDSSARKLWIFMASNRGLCGLRATLGELSRREKWPGESENGQISVTPRNIEVHRFPQEPLQARGLTKKMPNCIHSWASVLVETAGIEPASANPRPVSSTCVVCLRFRPSPSDRQDGYGLSLLGFNGAVTGAPRHDPAYMTVSSQPAERTGETVSGD